MRLLAAILEIGDRVGSDLIVGLGMLHAEKSAMCAGRAQSLRSRAGISHAIDPRPMPKVGDISDIEFIQVPE